VTTFAGDPDMPIASVNGQNLYYEDTGGRGPVLVFSHGLLMDHTMFAPQVQALQGRFRCISWDERGHGQTADPLHCAPFDYYDSVLLISWDPSCVNAGNMPFPLVVRSLDRGKR
jgi:pimeloyl-ACP methyl ester carboxylesterase